MAAAGIGEFLDFRRVNGGKGAADGATAAVPPRHQGHAIPHVFSLAWQSLGRHLETAANISQQSAPCPIGETASIWRRCATLRNASIPLSGPLHPPLPSPWR